MAIRTWARILTAAFGIGALAGASQLGVAYGLGLLRLARAFDLTHRDEWAAHLAWICWFTMAAAIIGAFGGGRVAARAGRPPSPPAMAALAVFAAIGAAIVVPLTMQPARDAEVGGVDPVHAVALCAGLGAAFGVLAGYATLAHDTARRGFGTLIITVWTLGVVSVLPALRASGPLPAVRLGVFDAGLFDPVGARRTALCTMPIVAFLTGAALGWVARRQDRPLLTVGLAGLPGPLLLTLAYLVAGPGHGGAGHYQTVPYWAAMVTTGAGVLGSVLLAVLRRDPDEDPKPVGGPPHAELTSPAPTRSDPTHPDPTSTGPFASAPWSGGRPEADDPTAALLVRQPSRRGNQAADLSTPRRAVSLLNIEEPPDPQASDR